MVTFGVEVVNVADWVYGVPVVPALPNSKYPAPISVKLSVALT
jgi:hypothetical protein